jgi:hypothetical protein
MRFPWHSCCAVHHTGRNVGGKPSELCISPYVLPFRFPSAIPATAGSWLSLSSILSHTCSPTNRLQEIMSCQANQWACPAASEAVPKSTALVWSSPQEAVSCLRRSPFGMTRGRQSWQSIAGASISSPHTNC